MKQVNFDKVEKLFIELREIEGMLRKLRKSNVASGFGYCSLEKYAEELRAELKELVTMGDKNTEQVAQKTLYERWKDTLKCPECGGNDFDIDVEESYSLGSAVRRIYLCHLYCEICGFSLNYGSPAHGGGKPIDFINNERERLHEKWRGKIKLSDLEMAEIA